MIQFVLILGVVLLGVAVTMVLRAITTPAGPSTETIEQISAYGFAGGAAAAASAAEAGPGLRVRLDDLTADIGRWLGRRMSRFKGADYRATARRGRHVHDDARAPPRDAVPRRRSSECSL